MKNLFALACGPLAVVVVAACSSSSTTPTPTTTKDTYTVATTDSGMDGSTDTGTTPVAVKPYNHAAICLTILAQGNAAKAHRFAVAANPSEDDTHVSFEMTALKTPFDKPNANAMNLSVADTVGTMFKLNNAPVANGTFTYTAPAGEKVGIPLEGNPISASEIELETLVLKGKPGAVGEKFCGGFTAHVLKPAGIPTPGQMISAKCLFYPLALDAALPVPTAAELNACP